MCYGAGCEWEDWRGECKKPRCEACPLDEEESQDSVMDFWDKVDADYRRAMDK